MPDLTPEQIAEANAIIRQTLDKPKAPPTLTIEERIRGCLLSAEADHTLRSGTSMTAAERKLLTGGAAWERAMQRTFKGICTRRDRRLALRRAAERLGVSA